MIKIIYKLLVALNIMPATVVTVDNLDDIPQYALDNWEELAVHRELIEKTPKNCNNISFEEIDNNTIMIHGGCFGIGITQDDKDYAIVSESYSFIKYELKV